MHVLKLLRGSRPHEMGSIADGREALGKGLAQAGAGKIRTPEGGGIALASLPGGLGYLPGAGVEGCRLKPRGGTSARTGSGQRVVAAQAGVMAALPGPAQRRIAAGKPAVIP
jgi:hypothetical protein